MALERWGNLQAKDYVAPGSVDEAVSVLAANGPGAKVLAGGTDIIIQVREGRKEASILVDVKLIPELVEYSLSAAGLRVGAATPCAKLYADPEVRRLYPALIDSATVIGSIQIQSRASLGGNLCNSSPAADSIPTMIALGGIAEIAGPGGRREVPVEQFCTGPGRNVLQAGELLVALRFPAPAANSGAAFERFIPRNEMDIAVVNAAASVTLSADGATFVSARVSIGAAAPTPLFVTSAADALAGQPVNEATIAKAADAARAAVTPITDMRGSAAQRKHLAGVLTTRVINTAIARARG